MRARRSVVFVNAARVGFRATLAVLTLSFGVAAQTAPPPAPADPAAPGAPPADAPPPPAGPAAEQPLPPPAEPTSPAEPPPPVAESPMLAEEPPPVPPPPPPEPDTNEDAGSDRSAGPFSKGTIRLTLLVGTGSTVTDTYLILGGGPGYFIFDGFEIGLDYEAWFLAEPVMHRVSPETRYVFHMIPVIKPYVGVFYRHTFVTGGFDDFDQVGARGGIYFVPKGGGMYIGGGAVYDRLLDCESSTLVDCDSVYPEIFVGVSI